MVNHIVVSGFFFSSLIFVFVGFAFSAAAEVAVFRHANAKCSKDRVAAAAEPRLLHVHWRL